jgi:DNA-binding transcriptional LysR family regulator
LWLNLEMANPPLPDIGSRQLVAVLAVAEYRSFIAAASALNISQPALTRIIKRVEDVLGVQLFERTTRQVKVSEAGREFLAVAQRIANDLRITVDNMRELAEQKRGQIIISSITSIANSLLPGMVFDYRAERPGIEIQIRDGVHGTVMEDVRSGVADFGINYIQDVPDAIDTRRLGQETFALALHRDHPLAGGPNDLISFADLAGVPLISMPTDSQTRRVLDAAAIARDVHLDHAVVVSQIPTMLNLVRANVGVGFAPLTAITGGPDDDLVCVRIHDLEIKLDVGIVRLRERGATPAAVGFMERVESGWPSD